MSPPWQLHLTPEATQELRDASRQAAARIARVLDALATAGPDSIETDHEGAAWTGRIISGDYAIAVAGRDGDSRIVVVRITLLDAHPAHQAVDLLPIRASARRKLGTVLQGLDLDLRYTLRALRRTPLFTAIVIATLAIGFGGATALLDIVQTVYRSALPFGDGERLVRLRNSNTSANGEIRRYNLTPRDWDLLRSNNRSFVEVVAQAGRSISLVGDGPSERISAIGVSANWAQTLRLRPIIGRTFTPDEERAGTDAGVGLISHALWQNRFGADSAVVGKTLRYDGGALTIIGVMPRSINYPYDAAVWTPWTFTPTGSTASSLNVIARLKDGVTMASAQADGARMHADRAAAKMQRSATAFDVATMRSDFIRDEARTVQALSFAVLFLLVLACMNVANLLVARFTTRRAELGLRAALGGRRDQQVRQMLIESLVLFATGTAAGMLVGNWMRGMLANTVPDVLRTQVGLSSNGVGTGVAMLTVGLGVFCGVAVGIIAGLRAVRTDPMMLVKQGGRGTIGRGDRRIFGVLVASQLSFSLVLLVGASLLIGRFRDLSGANPGYVLDDVDTMRITIEQERYRQPQARYELVRAIEERIAAVPGVASAGVTTVNPLCCGDWGMGIEIEGQVRGPNDPPTLVAHSYVTPGYFRAMRIPILKGSGFDERDRPDVPPTVVVDDAFARMAWPGENPIGKKVRSTQANQPWRTVTGVVPTTVHEAEMRASWFLPYYQDPTGNSTEQLHFMVHRKASVSMESLRDIVRQVDPALAVYGMTTMHALQSERTAQDRMGAVVSAVFAVFGLLLAGFSLYGLLSYSVELRSSEMGIRMALGASRHSIVGLILRDAAMRLAAGTVLGVSLALALNQLLRSSIDGLPWVPWQTLLGLTGLMALVTAAASALPALRATRVDPIRALRGS